MRTPLFLQAFAEMPRAAEPSSSFPWLVLWAGSLIGFVAGWALCSLVRAARLRAMLDTYDPLPALPVDDTPPTVRLKVEPRLPRERRSVPGRIHSPSEF